MLRHWLGGVVLGIRSRLLCCCWHSSSCGHTSFCVFDLCGSSGRGGGCAVGLLACSDEEEDRGAYKDRELDTKSDVRLGSITGVG